MIEQVIFVGIHYKIGFKALDSSTQSGKIIDLVIERIELPCEKTNLFPTPHMPGFHEGFDLRDKFLESVDLHALYVLLGADVRKYLEYQVPHFLVWEHPGYALRCGVVQTYILALADRINEIIPNQNLQL